ncbi:MAG: hypothetical protein JXN61_05505 [Sedimentisphaerales bacterium]|nr:hypothetical protein [Sedimentisphaerales bacterium]
MAKKLNFVVFESVGGRFGTEFVSINKQAGIAFNSAFYRKHNLKNYSHIALSYDAANRAVGFQFSSTGKPRGTWKLTHLKSSANVMARSFFNACGLDPETLAGRYEPIEYKDFKLGKLFYIILPKQGAKKPAQPAK